MYIRQSRAKQRVCADNELCTLCCALVRELVCIYYQIVCRVRECDVCKGWRCQQTMTAS